MSESIAKAIIEEVKDLNNGKQINISKRSRPSEEKCGLLPSGQQYVDLGCDGK